MTTDTTPQPLPSRDEGSLVDELAGMIADTPEMLERITLAISRAARLIHARRQLADMPEALEP